MSRRSHPWPAGLPCWTDLATDDAAPTASSGGVASAPQPDRS
ncbi:hypothetical protein [Quadrisphaera granulorum]|nr:hypothetical protein [Quadrisphaera granulorum]